MGARRGRPRGFDRDAALERAMLLFWERGYDAVSTRELCETMGISAPSLYNAFDSKQGLFEEVVRAYAEQYAGFVEEALTEAPDARRATEHLLTGAARQYTQPGCPAGCLIMNGATNYAPSSEEVAAKLTAIRLQVGRRVEQRIQADIDAGRIPESISAHHLATHVLAVWQGMALLARDGSGRADLEAGVETFMATWPSTEDSDDRAA